MKEKAYSQSPITDNNKKIGLLTDNAISRWLGDQYNVQECILIDNTQKISEVYNHKEDEFYYDFVSRNTRLYDVV